MKLEIKDRKEEPLLKRETIYVTIYHPGGGTPKRQETRVKLSETLKKDIKQVYIVKMRTEYGKHETKALAHVYNSAEDALKIEKKHIIKRNEAPPKKQ